MNSNQKRTIKQQEIINEMSGIHGLDERQISFEEDSTEPIFDYEALNVLRLRLTDIQTTEPEIVERNMTLGIVTARCWVYLPDGRSASDLGSAQFTVRSAEDYSRIVEGESMPDGSILDSQMKAQNVALSRALRRAIRAVGVNLMKAHRAFADDGEITQGDVDEEFQSKIGREIHSYAIKFGHITGSGKNTDKTRYQNFIESLFGFKKRSTLDLNDIEKSQLANTYRTLVNSRDGAATEQKLAA